MSYYRVALAQVNVTVGDLMGNVAKIVDYIEQAVELGADIISFPEMAVCGYPPEDLVLKPDFLRDNKAALKSLARCTKNLDALVVVGFVDSDLKNRVYNAAAVIYQGKVAAVYHKIYLPNYGVFDEKRYFLPGHSCPVFIYKGISFGVIICEDIWSREGPARYQAKEGKAALLINISALPYHMDKPSLREEVLKKRAVENKTVVCYTNLVGGQDELVFDGASLVVGPEGNILAKGKQFQEDLVLADVQLNTGRQDKKVKAVARGKLCLSDTNKYKPALPKRKISYLSRLEGVYQALVLGTHDYVRKNGFKKVVIGLSGGIDSALVAVIAVDALGKEDVIVVTMPSIYTSKGTRADALRLSQRLGIKLITLPINKIFKQYLGLLKPEFRGLFPDVTEENIQARIRGNLLMALSNKFGWLVLATGNKSEMGVGYCTLYGDMAGGFAVIKDVPKTLVYKLARYRNKKTDQAPIPASIVRRVPSAELRTGQKDEDSLPPYEKLDAILEAYLEQHKGLKIILKMGYPEDMVRQVIQMIDKSEYKRRQAPPGVKITPLAFGKDRRFPIVNRYNI